MFRMFLTMFLWVSVARWMYAEVGLIVPEAVPALDQILHHARIPTHDTWSLQKIIGPVRSGVRVASQIVDEHGTPNRESLVEREGITGYERF